MKNRIRKVAKLLLLICVCLAALPIGELVRETIAYELYARRLESENARLEPGMDRTELLSKLGPPDYVYDNQDGLAWEWNPRKHQGFLFTKLGFTSDKGHYGLTVEFDDAGRLFRADGAVN